MSKDLYGIGGTERPTETSEALGALQQNKTLMVQKLTHDDPIKPEIVEGLTNTEAVFDHFKPAIDMEFSSEEGSTVKETLKFANLGDFGSKGITNQSEYLKGLKDKQDEFLKIVKQLRTNKLLLTAMKDPENKAAIMSALENLKSELDNHK
jgi:hypothetical protein